jgi:hypothetical protein
MNEKFLIVNGIIAAQTPSVISPFKKILDEFDVIIEIGYNRGAFSKWLFDNKRKDAQLYCYDISDQFREIQDKNINFIVGDCFSPNILNNIHDQIKIGRCIILCDGGDKEHEFGVFSKMIKPRDVIMCHDYSHSSELYNTLKNKLNWPSASESHYDNIKYAITLNNLTEFNYEEFYNVFWGSFIKL